MGWASGSNIACEMTVAIKNTVTEPVVRKMLYLNLINVLEDHDWDTQEEAMGIDPLFDEAMKFLHPTWWEEGDE